jgi:hypothetical protein
MSWSLMSKPQVVRSTRKLAEHFATMTPCPHDRPRKPRIDAMLQKAIEENQFRSCVWASAKCKETGETYRVNGKHTSFALHESNGHLTEWPYVQVEEYTCDTMQDVADLYCTFDPSRSGRSSADVNRIFLATNSELSEVSSRHFAAATTGIAFAAWESSYGHHDARERAMLALSYPGFVLWYDGHLHDKDGLFMFLRGGVVAAMFRSWQKSQKDATTFWQAVREGSGAKPSDPDRKLRDFLMRVTPSARPVPGRVRVDMREFFIKSLHAWNAWRRGENSDLKYYANAKTPAAV